ncbi:hypothetical protein AAF712_014597 [Marasmius tenuissimus]|uniref:F-box domain-containing protein n=1 Tax=Marasmius tenuissimus TaxID=585030 RepID=A0ABR2ZBW9_9AGAR
MFFNIGGSGPETQRRLDMPVEVFMIVCSFLPFTSLVSMAGVSRDFRYPLLEALSFWVVFARENNLPGIPHGLDVYAWLSFVFMQKNICQVCKKSYSDPIFILNCRLCFTCLKLLCGVLLIDPTVSIFQYALPHLAGGMSESSACLHRKRGHALHQARHDVAADPASDRVSKGQCTFAGIPGQDARHNEGAFIILS